MTTYRFDLVCSMSMWKDNIVMKVFLLAFVFLAVGSSVAFAASSSSVSPVESAPAPVSESISAEEMAERVKLSTELHDIRNIRDSVNATVAAYAKRLPEKQREGYMQAIELSLDYEKIEQVSINEAAKVFTPAELRAMISYFGSPEGRSAEQKMGAYSKKVVAEVQRGIDAAIMASKLGEIPKK